MAAIGYLLNRLARTDSKAVARPIVWALESLTGLKTQDLIERKGVSISYGSGGQVQIERPDLYQRDGFSGIGGLLGAGYVGSSGIIVRPETVLRCSAFLAGVKIISEDIGTMPFFPFEKSDEDRPTISRLYGNLYEILHDQPNPEMSAGPFREALTARAIMGMDGYARIERTSQGTITLWPIGLVQQGGWIDGTVRTERNNANQPVYYVKEGNAAEKQYASDQLFHLPGFTMDGYSGDDTLLRMRDVLGLTIAGQEYASRFFSQDASPNLVVTRPVGVTAWGPDRVTEWKQAWLGYFSGMGGKHIPALVQDGMTVSRIDPDHQKLQMLESRTFQIAEVARFLRMPLHKLAELSRSTNNNIEHQGIEYVTQCLGPWRLRWEQAFHRCLLTPEQRYWSPSGRPRMFARLEEKALMRGDFVTQVTALTKLQAAGNYSQNEVRAIFDMNPIEGGDKYYIQLNMQAVGDTANEALAAVPAVAEV